MARASVTRKGDYLKALAVCLDVEQALEEADWTVEKLEEERKTNGAFRSREGKILGLDPKMSPKEHYLRALKQHYGNKSKARTAAGLNYKQYAVLAKDAEFAEKENEIWESFLDDMNEQSLRLALGANPQVRDAQHLRWKLPKVDKRWEDRPQQIEHRYSGNVTVRSIDEEIALLLGSDEVEVE